MEYEIVVDVDHAVPSLSREREQYTMDNKGKTDNQSRTALKSI
jgi:hypothetical protein